MLNRPCALTCNFSRLWYTHHCGKLTLRVLVAMKRRQIAFCGVTLQPSKAAGFTVSLFVKTREAHLCYEKKTTQTRSDGSGSGSGSLPASWSNKGSWAPWWAVITGADLPCRHVRNITRQTDLGLRERLYSCQRDLSCGGGCNWNTPAICRHVRYFFHLGNFLFFLFFCCCPNIKAEEIHLSWFYDTFK